jgi:release factor glutamine methyltransferase
MAALVIEHFLGIPNTMQLIDRETALDEQTYPQLQAVLQRLENQEPIQYVLGHTEFFGRRFKTDLRGLIPRPETEELVQMVIREGYDQESILLDVGTGTGCIAITLALETGARIYALDVEPGALELALENATALGASVEFVLADFLHNIPKLPMLDAIISNPPYVPGKDLGSLENRVKDFEPLTALLVPDDNPLLFYERIASWAPGHLKPGGQVFLEIYHTAGPSVMNLFRGPQWSQVSIKKDLQGKDRMVKASLKN